MAKTYFKFKQFIINQDKTVFKVGTDGVLLGACAEFSRAKRILDIGTGTGLIAIMAAQRSDAEIVAIEPEEGSCSQASENIKLCKWSERIRIINVAFEDFYKGTDNKFDVIISNPPYFRNSLENPDHLKSTTRHSVSLTSTGILEGADKLLENEGSLQLILPYEEGTLFIAEAMERGFFVNRIINVIPVPEGEIKRLIMKFEKVSKPLYEKYVTIETGVRHHFTEDYKELTRDFYLRF